MKLKNEINPEDLVFGKHNFNRYELVIRFISNFLAEVTNIDEMYKMLQELNNKISELKSDCLVGEDEKINDVIKNASLIHNN